MIKRAWVRRYDQLPKSGLIIQSWDVANKQGEENDYSVCTTVAGSRRQLLPDSCATWPV